MLIVLFKGTFVKSFIEKSIRYWSYMKPPVIFSHDEQLSYQVFWKLNHSEVTGLRKTLENLIIHSKVTVEWNTLALKGLNGNDLVYNAMIFF